MKKKSSQHWIWHIRLLVLSWPTILFLFWTRSNGVLYFMRITIQLKANTDISNFVVSQGATHCSFGLGLWKFTAIVGLRNIYPRVSLWKYYPKVWHQINANGHSGEPPIHRAGQNSKGCPVFFRPMEPGNDHSSLPLRNIAGGLDLNQLPIRLGINGNKQFIKTRYQSWQF